LVVSSEPEVRQRARELFEQEPELEPLIVEPDLIPQIVDFSQARREPELTILSAVMHARSETAVACGRAALVALLAVPRENQQCYLDLVSACLTEDQMAEAAEQLPPEVEIELSKMELESYAYAKGLRRGREAGVEEGRKEGNREALQAACAALVTRLRATLAQRGIELDLASRARVERCQDLEQLSLWLVRAATATSTNDLFDAHA
jgi:flagellar biosynthesis/type III secretory pathway protein FliH